MFLTSVILIGLVFRQAKTNYPEIKILNAVVNGPLLDIANLDKELLLYNVKYLQNINIPRERKKAVFKRIKGDRRLDEMNMTELEMLGNFLQGIPSYDLGTQVDCKKVDLVSFLGKMKLHRKLLGCLAQCLKKEHGKQVFLNYRFINKFVGVICGYGVEELQQIDEDNFILIDGEVFINLDECDLHQMKALYNIAVQPTVYGIPQGWDKSVVRSIGSLLSITPLLDLMGMDPMSFTEVKPNVLKDLSSDKLEVLQKHLRYYSLTSRQEIWKKIGIPSESLAFHRNRKCVLFLFVCLKIFYLCNIFI